MKAYFWVLIKRGRELDREGAEQLYILWVYNYDIFYYAIIAFSQLLLLQPQRSSGSEPRHAYKVHDLMSTCGL